MQIRFVKMHPRAHTPTRGTDGAAGFDLYAAHAYQYVIQPLGRVSFDTMLKLEIPPGFEGQVRSRSGLSLKHGIVVVNSPGTIDSDFRGLLCVLLLNVSPHEYIVQPGDRIAQLVIARVEAPEFVEVEELSPTGRGDNGYGSTGR